MLPPFASGIEAAVYDADSRSGVAGSQRQTMRFRRSRWRSS